MAERTLGQVDEWYTKWCQPVVEALYARNRQAAESALAQVRAELERGKLDEDHRQALRFQLDYLAYQIEKATGRREDVSQHHAAAIAALSHDTDGAVSRIMQARLLLQLKISGMRSGQGELPPAEFERLLAAIPEGDRDLELWHYICNWAFIHQQGAYLAQALEEYVVQAPGIMSDYLFQRVNAMHLLVERRAMRADITELLSRMRLREHYEDFVRHIYPVCCSQGLIDDELEALLKAKDQVLAAQGPPAKLFEMV